MTPRDPQIHVRIPQDLKDWVEAEAARQDRTQNAHIVHCLKQARLRASAGQSGEPAAGEASQA
jgi:predicted HicB family RNase H-like nuclease